MTTAARAASGSTLARRRSSSEASPPVTTVAAATWPLGVWRSVVPRLAEQAMNTSLSASIVGECRDHRNAQAAGATPPALRSNATPIARASGRITA